MAATAKDIIASLPKLGAAELRQIRAALDYLLSKEVKSSDDQLVYQSLTSVLGTGIPYQNFLKSTASQHWDRKLKSFLLFLDENFRGITKIQKRGLIKYMLILIVDDLQGKGLTPTLGMVVTNLDRVASVFDDNFPDYRKAGLTHIVLKQLKGKPSEDSTS